MSSPIQPPRAKTCQLLCALLQCLGREATEWNGGWHHFLGRPRALRMPYIQPLKPRPKRSMCLVGCLAFIAGRSQLPTYDISGNCTKLDQVPIFSISFSILWQGSILYCPIIEGALLSSSMPERSTDLDTDVTPKDEPIIFTEKGTNGYIRVRSRCLPKPPEEITQVA